jgi:hypothetical protein
MVYHLDSSLFVGAVEGVDADNRKADLGGFNQRLVSRDDCVKEFTNGYSVESHVRYRLRVDEFHTGTLVLRDNFGKMAISGVDEYRVKFNGGNVVGVSNLGGIGGRWSGGWVPILEEVRFRHGSEKTEGVGYVPA